MRGPRETGPASKPNQNISNLKAPVNSRGICLPSLAGTKKSARWD